MLEYFLWKRYTTTPSQSSNESFSNDYSYLSNYNPITIVLSLIISIYAGYLAYHCTKKSPSVVFHYLSIVLAFLLNGLYLLYYFIRYILLRDVC